MDHRREEENHGYHHRWRPNHFSHSWRLVGEYLVERDRNHAYQINAHNVADPFEIPACGGKIPVHMSGIAGSCGRSVWIRIELRHSHCGFGGNERSKSRGCGLVICFFQTRDPQLAWISWFARVLSRTDRSVGFLAAIVAECQWPRQTVFRGANDNAQALARPGADRMPSRQEGCGNKRPFGFTLLASTGSWMRSCQRRQLSTEQQIDADCRSS